MLASPAVFEHRDGGDVHGDGLPSLTSNNCLADINKKFVWTAAYIERRDRSLRNRAGEAGM
jgi:hypothetical protein